MVEALFDTNILIDYLNAVPEARTELQLVGRIVDPPLHLSPCRNYGVQHRKHNS